MGCSNWQNALIQPHTSCAYVKKGVHESCSFRIVDVHLCIRPSQHELILLFEKAEELEEERDETEEEYEVEQVFDETAPPTHNLLSLEHFVPWAVK